MFKVHNELGRYCNEQQYTDALEEILKQEKIIYSREKFLIPSFPGEKKRNIPDFTIEDKIIVDLKAKRIITKEDYYQMRRYLKAANKRLGLIVNFRDHVLRPKRILSGIDSQH